MDTVAESQGLWPHEEFETRSRELLGRPLGREMPQDLVLLERPLCQQRKGEKASSRETGVPGKCSMGVVMVSFRCQLDGLGDTHMAGKILFLEMPVRVFPEHTDVWISGLGKEDPPSPNVGGCHPIS